MTDSRKYKCRECKVLFSSVFDLRQHGNTHYGEFPFMCATCKEHFPTVDDYAVHAVIHLTTKSDKKFEIAETGYLEGTNASYDAGKIKEPETVVHLSVISQDLKSTAGIEGKKERKRQRQISAGSDVTQTKESHRKLFAKCQFCNLKFESIKEYCEHKKDAHNFLCKNCNNRFCTTEKLARHICFISSDGEPFKCSCLLTFTKIDEFKIHVGQVPYSCCKCSMQFNKVTNLIRHIRTHTNQKPYVCKQCGRGFTQSTNLKNHASVHLGVNAINCDECNFSCKTVSGLIKHKKKHNDGCLGHSMHIDRRKTSTGITTCPICNKEFLFKRNVGMHLKVHKRRELLCQICGKVFDRKSKLTTHYKACHGVPSNCQICGKTFASSVLLAAHKKIHVSGKKFSCSRCCKMFSTKNYLSQHMKTHTKRKQYSCSKCGKLFKVSSSLKYHSKICSAAKIS